MYINMCVNVGKQMIFALLIFSTLRKCHNYCRLCFDLMDGLIILYVLSSKRLRLLHYNGIIGIIEVHTHVNIHIYICMFVAFAL